MLFFRSEERVQDWCRDRKAPVRPIVSMAQLWGLATHWYGNRLSPDARRPSAAEMREIFASLGLAGSFWDPAAGLVDFQPGR
jgi:hypothetical protein